LTPLATLSFLTWDTARWCALILMLSIAAAWDVRQRRIPNALTLTGALAGLLLGAGQPGWMLSLLGGMVAFSFFMVLHRMGWIGAGDVKLAAAAGVYFSPSQALHACLLILLAGGVLAALWAQLPRTSIRHDLPYGVAIALGAGYQAWQVSAL
jgi:Flp pilus assembly protein protease CpaA